jgi:hypothetical protein
MDISAVKSARVRILRRFAGDESGSMIVLALIFFTLMIMVGGLAVDLMRYEARRTQLQQTTDRAVLAAASLRQPLVPEDVVNDYFTKAGLIDKLKAVRVTEDLNRKMVEVEAESLIDPFFVHMLGIEDMTAPADGTAEERITDVEISFVLDISGSMNSYSRIDNLKDAATEFVDLIFEGAEAGRTTMSIVPYSGQVNLGADLIDEFNVTLNHTYSYCVDLPASSFTSTTVSTSTSIPHAGNMDPFYSSQAASLYYCPPQTANTVLPLSADTDALKAKINGLVADGNTSIDIGMKWGTLLLDPVSGPIIDGLIGKDVVEDRFSDRPLDPASVEVLKIVVLMSDGENTTEYVLKDPYRANSNSNIYRRDSDGQLAAYHDQSGSNDYYMPGIKYEVANSSSGKNTFSETTKVNGKNVTKWYTRWQSQPFGTSTGWTRLTWPQVWQYSTISYVASNLFATPRGESSSTWQSNFRSTTGTSTKNTRLQQICNAAKAKGYTVYTIGFEAPTAGKTQLSQCATSTGYFYEVVGTELRTALRSIASQVTHLRLTQ